MVLQRIDNNEKLSKGILFKNIEINVFGKEKKKFYKLIYLKDHQKIGIQITIIIRHYISI